MQITRGTQIGISLLIHCISSIGLLSTRFKISETKCNALRVREYRTIRKAVSVPIFTSIVYAFVCSRIDYSNSLLIGLPKTRLSPLQTVLNAATRLIARLPRYSHISYVKEHLH